MCWTVPVPAVIQRRLVRGRGGRLPDLRVRRPPGAPERGRYALNVAGPTCEPAPLAPQARAGAWAITAGAVYDIAAKTP